MLLFVHRFCHNRNVKQSHVNLCDRGNSVILDTEIDVLPKEVFGLSPWGGDIASKLYFI